MTTTAIPPTRLEPIDPDERKDYAIDFSAECAETSDTISSAAWGVSVPAGLTLTSPSVMGGTKCVIWVAAVGATAGVDYLLTVTATSANSPSRIYQRSILIPCRTR
jgi:hypothetical protein